MSNGKHISVTTKDWSKKAVYVSQVLLNGKKHTKSYLTWDDIKDGADILFVMSTKPNRKWATAVEDIAPSVSLPGKTLLYKPMSQPQL